MKSNTISLLLLAASFAMFAWSVYLLSTPPLVKVAKPEVAVHLTVLDAEGHPVYEGKADDAPAALQASGAESISIRAAAENMELTELRVVARRVGTKGNLIPLDRQGLLAFLNHSNPVMDIRVNGESIETARLSRLSNVKPLTGETSAVGTLWADGDGHIEVNTLTTVEL